MRATKLVKLFLTLDSKELTRFRKYLKSEGNGHSVDIQLLLYDYLKTNGKKKIRTGPGFEDLLDVTIIQKRLSHQNKSVKTANMNKIKSGLYKNLTDAIIYYQLKKERSEENNLQRKMVLIRYLKDKLSNDNTPNQDLSDLYTTTIQDLQKSKKTMTKKTLFDYLDLHVLNDNLYFNVDTDAWGAGEAMNDLNDSIDLYYCLTKLKYCTEVMIRQRILNETNSIRLKNDIRRIADEFMGSPMPLIQIYARCFDLFDKSEFDEVGLTALVSLIKKNLHLDISELAIIITFTNNYIALSKKRSKNSNKMEYDLYKIAFEKDLFIDEGFLEPNKLINYVFICNREGKENEIPQIISTHLEKVKNKGKKAKKDGPQDKTYVICQAYYLFAVKKFGEAFELLFKKSFRNEPYFRHFRILRIQTIYEVERAALGKFDFLDYTDTVKECNNFINALKVRIEVYNQAMYVQNVNFAQMVIKMYHHTQDVNATKTQKEALLIELESIQNIAYRSWLKLRINEL